MTDDRDVASATRIITADTPNEAIMFPTLAVYVHSHEPGEQEGLHTHAEHHVLVMRSGRMRWTVDTETVDAGAGDVIVAPAGTPHGFEVLGEDTVKLLCIETRDP
jgi:mannose-6-phosphate isomerase-like protein (cupin superfamily)